MQRKAEESSTKLQQALSDARNFYNELTDLGKEIKKLNELCDIKELCRQIHNLNVQLQNSSNKVETFTTYVQLFTTFDQDGKAK